MWRHIHTVHEGQKDNKCESCGKLFSQAANLKRHIHLIHEGNKDYKCESCGKSFSHAWNLKKHLQSSCKSQKLQMWILWQMIFSRKSFEDTCHFTRSSMDYSLEYSTQSSHTSYQKEPEIELWSNFKNFVKSRLKKKPASTTSRITPKRPQFTVYLEKNLHTVHKHCRDHNCVRSVVIPELWRNTFI